MSDDYFMDRINNGLESCEELRPSSYEGGTHPMVGMTILEPALFASGERLVAILPPEDIVYPNGVIIKVTPPLTSEEFCRYTMESLKRAGLNARLAVIVD